MRGTILIGVAGLASAFAAPAHAESYVQFNAGALVAGDSKISVAAGSLSEDLESGKLASAVFGEEYDAGWKNVVSIEAEALYLSSDIDTADIDAALVTLGYPSPLDASVDSWGLLANAKYNFHITDMISPYIGAGVGYGNVSYSLYGADEDNDGVVWQVLAGVGFKISPRATIDVGYRYVELPEFDYPGATGTLSFETTTQAVNAGIRIRF